MKKRLSSFISFCIMISMFMPVVSAQTDVIEEIHVTSGNESNCIVVQSSSYIDFNIYRKADDGALTLVELQNAKDANGNTTSNDKWEYCNRRLYLDENLTNGKKYVYVVKAVDAEGNEVGAGEEVSGTPFETAYNKTKFPVNDFWSYWNASGHSYGYAAVKEGAGINNSNGLYISKMGENDANNGFTSVTYDFGTVLSSGKVYKFVWQQKITKCNWAGSDGIRVQAQSSTDGITWSDAIFVPFESGENDGQWHTKTMYVKGTGQSSLEFYVLKTASDLVFDNFELYEVDAETLEKVSSSNMLAFCNPTFDASSNDNGVVLTSYFADSEITLDGSLSESEWHMAKDFLYYGSSVGKFGTLWNGEYVYFALDSINATSLTLTFGNITTKYDISKNEFAPETDGALAVTSGNITEIALPLESCGIYAKTETQTVDFGVSLEVNGKNVSLATDKITLIFSSLIYNEDMDDFSSTGFAQGTSWANTGSTLNDVIFKQSESYPGAVNLYNNSTSQEVCKGWRYNYGSVITGAFDLEFTINFEDLPVLSTKDSSWHGFVFELNTDRRHRFSFTADENGNVLFNTLYWLSGAGSTGQTVTKETGVKIGDTVTVRLSVSSDKKVKLYIDGNPVTELSTLTMSGGNQTTFEWCVYQRFATDGNVNVHLYDMAISNPVILTDEFVAQSILDNITFDDILGDNEKANMVAFNLVLPEEKSVFGLDSYPVTWTSSDEFVVDGDGVITGGSSEGESVTLTASVTVGKSVKTKDFKFVVYTKSDKALLYLERDLNPYTGKLKTTYIPFEFTLDDAYSSVGYDMGYVQKINNVILTDSDDVHRLNEIELSLYVSDDNVTYRRVKDFDMSSADGKIYLYNFNETARYVKVHSHYDSSDFYKVSDGASFLNKIDKMITAGYENNFPGNGGGVYEKLGSVNVIADKKGDDLTAYISYEKLNSKAFCNDYRDLRVTLDGNMLPYYTDEDGVYVRIPSADAGNAFILDIYGNNENSISLSDIDSVFEVTYGNKTIMEMSVPDTEFDDAMRVTTAPNGDLIAIAYKRDAQQVMTMRRSTDGGRTWGDVSTIRTSNATMDGGGFIVDNGKIWYIFDHKELGYPELAIITSDDNGYTWSEALTIPTGTNYSLTYFDGVKAASYDGVGEGIDYVAPFSYARDLVNMGDFAASVIYSADDGKTWQRSEDYVSVAWDEEHTCTEKITESGVSENSITVLSNGDILMYARCEFDENPGFFAKAISKDNGLTWSDIELSEVNTTNTLPAFKNLGSDLMLLWGGHSDVSPRKQQRYPLALAYSPDDGETWLQKLDLWSGTSRANYICHGANAGIIRAVQSSITVSNTYGANDAYLSYHEEWNHNTGMLIEDIDDFLHKTKGAADDFENVSSALDEGWLAYRGTVEVTDEKAYQGDRSLKIEDVPSMITRASRAVPMTNDGELSFNFNIEKANTGFNVEMKSTFNYETYQSALAMVHINQNGYVFASNTAIKSTGNSLAQISLNEWHNMRIVFDIEKDSAELYIDGEFVGNMPVNTENVPGGVCFVQISDGSSSATPGLTAYIDNFVLAEGVNVNVFEPNVLSIKDMEVSASGITDDCVLIVAEYSDGKLLATEMYDISEDTNIMLNDTIFDLRLGNEIKAFLWSDRMGINPLGNSVSYMVPEIYEYGENLILNSDFTDENGNGTLEGWSLYSSNATVQESGMSTELSEATVDGVTKPVLKWNYRTGDQGNIRYLDYKIGKLEPGDYLVSVTVSIPGNPGADSFGITKDSNGDMVVDNGYEIGRFTSDYVTYTKTVTITEELKDIEQSFRISSNGYGDTGSLYVWEASVRKITVENE